MEKEKVRIDAMAAGVAAYDLVQKIFLLLIERGALTIVDAQVILRDSIETQQEIMDAEWAPVNEAAAVLLSRFFRSRGAATWSQCKGLGRFDREKARDMIGFSARSHDLVDPVAWGAPRERQFTKD